MGLSFNPNGGGSWNDILSGTQSTGAQQPQVAQRKIYIYLDQAQQGPVQPQQKAQVPKAPKKELQGMNWLVANMTN